MDTPKNIGFSGTQKGMTPQQRTKIKKILKKKRIKELHHGDCIGADEQVHNIATWLQIPIWVHPPDKENKRAFCLHARFKAMPKPYLERNKDIVNASNLMLFTPAERAEQKRSGTWSTIRYARKQKKNHIIVFPDGTTEENEYTITEGLLK